MSTKRILFYCDEYPPATSGGIGSATKIIAENLALNEHYIVVAGSYEYGTINMTTTTINGVIIYRFSYFNFLRFIPKIGRRFVKAILRRMGVLSMIAKKNLLRNEQKIEDLLLKHEIEIIELIDYMALLTEIKNPISLQEFKIPATLRIHGSVSFLNLNKGLFHKQQLNNDRSNFKRANKLTAVSQYAANFVNSHILIEKRNIEIIHNPVEDSIIRETNTSVENRLLFIGKITMSKGAFNVIKAFQAIANRYPEWTLCLIGGGELQTAKQLIQTDFKSRIVLTGYVQRAEVLSYIESSAFVVIPSFFENFSMVPLEVMARKKALIYTKRTSGSEIIQDGQNGILVDPENIEEISEKMTCLLDDAKKRAVLAENGFQTVKSNFTVSNISQQLLTHYSSLIVV